MTDSFLFMTAVLFRNAFFEKCAKKSQKCIDNRAHLCYTIFDGAEMHRENKRKGVTP